MEIVEMRQTAKKVKRKTDREEGQMEMVERTQTEKKVKGKTDREEGKRNTDREEV